MIPMPMCLHARLSSSGTVTLSDPFSTSRRSKDPVNPRAGGLSTMLLLVNPSPVGNSFSCLPHTGLRLLGRNWALGNFPKAHEKPARARCWNCLVAVGDSRWAPWRIWRSDSRPEARLRKLKRGNPQHHQRKISRIHGICVTWKFIVISLTGLGIRYCHANTARVQWYGKSAFELSLPFQLPTQSEHHLFYNLSTTDALFSV